MSVRDEAGMHDEIGRLQRALDERDQEAAAKEQQLERYAADLRETYKQERQRAQELRESYAATVRALSNAVEARDAYTGKHAERVAAYGLAIAKEYGMPVTDELEFGFLLHDIGKVAVSDSILHKPEPLSDAERALMREHPQRGVEIIRGIAFLSSAVAVIRHHHEHWDGTGYPQGLAGEEIPLEARIFAVADVFDALTTRRPYREPSSIAQARAMISEESGTHFDPAVVEAFERIPDEVLAGIAEEIS
jgi:putative nucleotidyltransferase with HDIG domain